MTKGSTYRAWNLLLLVVATLSLAATAAFGRQADGASRVGIGVFAAHCFSPLLTGKSAAERLGLADIRVDFYDLDPFTKVAPTPAGGAPATPGTDRRCEVSFDGAHTKPAVDAVLGALQREGIMAEAEVPASIQPQDGTALLAARRLNPRKIAVVHVGTRPGPNGIETFMNVERFPLPLNQN